MNNTIIMGKLFFEICIEKSFFFPFYCVLSASHVLCASHGLSAFHGLSTSHGLGASHVLCASHGLMG